MERFSLAGLDTADTGNETDDSELPALEWAPWHIIPSDHKWFRNLTVARIVAATLEEMDPVWPPPEEDLERFANEELDQLSSR